VAVGTAVICPVMRTFWFRLACASAGTPSSSTDDPG
jgi:hypothetical protein